jgi:hypothetical protein
MNIIDIPVKTPKTLHKFLPSSHLLITAPTASGKTILMLNMITRKVFPYYRYYDKIYIFSPTLGLDNSWSILEEDDKYILNEELDEEIIYEILEEQRKNILTKGKNKTKHRLIIIDDLGGDMKNINYKFLVPLIMKLRHSNIHIWITTQSYRAIPRGMRLNFLYHIIFRVSPQELEIISKEINGSIDEEIFRKIFNNAITERPYNFLYIDIRKQSYYSGFKFKYNIKNSTDLVKNLIK